MSKAANIQILHEGGYKDQALKMAESESISVEQDWGNETTTYTFPDGTALQASGSEMMEVPRDADLVEVRTVEVKEPSFIDSIESIDPSAVEATGNAEPTSRVLNGSRDHGYAEEWSEPAVMPDGRKCSRIYLFTESEIVNDDGEPLEAENYPWDDGHVARILLAD
jgi:hypothetical protein